MRYSIALERRRKARISICVPTYNGAHRVDWLCQSLHRVQTPLEEVALTILDDGSPNKGNLLDLSVRYSANLLVHHQNEGVTRAWNDLVRFVDSEFVVLLNDDVVVTPNWLKHLVFFMEQNECGTVSPDLWFCTESDIHSLLAGHFVAPREQSTKEPQPWLANVDPTTAPKVCIAALGCAFAFRRDAFEALGGFDERTRMTHNESWLGTAMAAHRRVPSFILPDHVWHVGGATFRQNPGLHDQGDREAFIAHWDGYFESTSPRFMRGMPARTVKWLDANNEVREQEFHMRWWD